MKKIIILVLVLILCSSAFAQQYTSETKFAFALNFKDAYDALKGKSNLGTSIQFSPIIPILPTDTIGPIVENKTLNCLYFVPFMQTGYNNDEWGIGAGGGIAYDFGKFYTRYSMELFTLNEGEKFNTSSVYVIGFGLSVGAITTLSNLNKVFLDIYYRYDPVTPDPQLKEQIEFSLVVLIL